MGDCCDKGMHTFSAPLVTRVIFTFAGIRTELIIFSLMNTRGANISPNYPNVCKSAKWPQWRG